MPNNDLPQRMYTPLSQNMTDSESEEDLNQRLHQHHNNNHQLKTNQSNTLSSVIANGTRSRMIINNHHTMCTTVGRSLQESGNTTNYTNLNSDGEERHLTEADNVRILGGSGSSIKETATTSKSMSTIRRVLFILSLLLCLIIVVLFLWVIPCSDDANCPARLERTHTHNWIRNYEKIELKGAINVVNGLHGRSKNLVLMYRGDKLFNEFQGNVNVKRNGIISVIGSSSQVGWYDEIVNEPKIIDCTLIDVDKSGSPDCLIVDEFGEIGCINPISGEWIWHIVDRTTKSAEFLSFPLILPDLNGDVVNDLLVAASIDQGYYNHLKLISGATGRTIGRTFPINECSYIYKFQLDQRYKVSFNCISNDTEIQIVKPLLELYRIMTNKSDSPITIKKQYGNSDYPIIPQHKYYGQRKDTLSQRNIYSVSGKQLIVENNGKCPDSCNVSVQLIEQKNGKDHVIGHISGSRMYGMVPASFSFNNTGIHGFVLKFWEWSGVNNTVPIDKNRRTQRSPEKSSEYNYFKDELTKKHKWLLPQGDTIKLMRQKRNASNLNIKAQLNTSTGQLNPQKSMTRYIKETVVLMVCNSTDIRIYNTSQSNVVQFCAFNDAVERSISPLPTSRSSTISCQPDLNYQENSLLIADLDDDGLQELVSYYSTFMQRDNDAVDAVGNDQWHLVTYVQLLRLESEVRKLYSSDIFFDSSSSGDGGSSTKN